MTNNDKNIKSHVRPSVKGSKKPSKRERSNINKTPKRTAPKKTKQNRASTKILNTQINSHSDKKVQSSSVPNKEKKANLKKVSIFAGLAILVVAVGIVAGIVGFMFHTSNSISVPAETKKALSRVQDNTPVYMLYAASTEPDSSEYDVLLLCRADFSDKQVMIISVPLDTYVASASGGATTLKNISNNNGDAALIEAVSSFSDVGINYFVKMTAEGIVKTVDQFGGIDVNIKEEVDDPSAGKTYIASGYNHLDGSGALTLLRTKNVSDSDIYYNNQRQFARGLVNAVFGNSKKDMAKMIDLLSDCFNTNMSVNELVSFSDKLYGVTDDDILDDCVPGYRTLRENKKVFIVDATSWKAIRTNMGYGMLSEKDNEVTAADINPGSFTIQVQNGSGVDGAAALIAGILTENGFNVVQTGNADVSAYKETIIIYDKDDMKKNAQAVANTISNGRLVQSNGMYNLKTDILIIIGGDLTI